MRKQKDHLKVIPGKGTGQKHLTELTRRPVYFLLLILALFLLSQILVGWVWGAVGRSFIKTELVMEGIYEYKINTSGLITFQEHLVLAPASGFVYYNVECGKRVPVGKEIASISNFPLEERDGPNQEGVESEATLRQFKNWLLYGDSDQTEDYAYLFPGRDAVGVHSPYAGVVNLVMDGWEKIGPYSGFVYLKEEEFVNKGIEPQTMYSGTQVHPSVPILRIIDNYSWYYSTIIPSQYSRAILDKEEVTLYFEFEPDLPVSLRSVEQNQRPDGDYEVTWCVDRKIGDCFSRRWAAAEIVYRTQEGVLLPKDAYWETGVFVVNRGRIHFIEITVLAEKEDYFLVEGLSPYERVVLNPSRVKDGQRFYH